MYISPSYSYLRVLTTIMTAKEGGLKEGGRRGVEREGGGREEGREGFCDSMLSIPVRKSVLHTSA